MIEFRDEKKTKTKTIYIGIVILVIIVVITIVASQLLKYQVEGEKNLPFSISKFLIISTADGMNHDTSDSLWNLEISQTNDIYIEINKNNDKNDLLKKITLQNFNIISSPQKGEPRFYQPVNDKDLIYLYKDENIVNDKIEYNVSTNNNIKKHEISNTGGIISFSSCNNNIASYVSNSDTQIQYDGTLLTKTNIMDEEIKYQISFDIIVEMESNKAYKATITLDLPPDNLRETGTVQHELSDFDNIVFKRI